MAAGNVSGETDRVVVELGSEVRIEVTADVPDEVHVHGYDLATVGLVAALYVGGTVLSSRISAAGGGPTTYAHSLIPIAAGYALAHYFSLLLLDGQLTWILASDPFQSGLNLFGTAYDAVNYTLVSPRTISLVQVGAIVLGHVVGVVLADDLRRAGRARAPDARRAIPPAAGDGGLHVCGLGLLLG